ncbi:hypothetical protein TNCV_199621 [Trichonephila clavipes]|nr:hypothetical protein TNCV_199621 [Trichonephila clavipes]
MQQRRKKHYNSITDMRSWSAPLHGKSSGALGFKPVTRQRWPRVRYHDHSPTAEYYYGNKITFSQRSSCPRLIEDETFNDCDIINNLIDYEDGQEAEFFESG